VGLGVRPFLSFIVPAHNEERLLDAVLSAIEGSGSRVGRPFEVIVVDDASTDRTADIARQHGAHLVQVEYRGISKVRNAGAAVAGGEVLIFVDGDTLINPQAVSAALAALRSGAVGGGCRMRFGGRIPWYGSLAGWAFKHLYRWSKMASGAFLFVSREAFDEVGGFNETLHAAEELNISRKLGEIGRVAVLRESVVTSGRKWRTYSAGRIFSQLWRLLTHLETASRTSDGLEMWYDEKPADPEHDEFR
jgi:glycosyltransferase involved in cell wall biosynthesis